MKRKKNWGILLGAAFLMATSAVGPGFLTQTTVFTQQLGASFGFVILVSIILDIGVQLNVWPVIAVAQKRAQDIANQLLPGLGIFISVLILLGGLAFNVGNIAGTGLALQILLGISPKTGALLAAAIAIGIFLVKEAGKLMDWFAQVMGLLMILLIVYVAITSNPPMAEAARKTLLPDTIDFMAIITLVGGTVGGYITFAGGHRLLDAGLKGEGALPQVKTSAVSGILVASVIRVFLFLATLGVVAKAQILNPENPPASVFQLAAGNLGYKLFGLVLLAAATTSVVGAAYTSVSFIKSWHPAINKHQNRVIILFILLSAAVFIWLGQPIRLLLLAGALNGLILPITLTTILMAAHQQKIIGTYQHPRWLTAFGILIVILMSWMGGYTLVTQMKKLFTG